MDALDPTQMDYLSAASDLEDTDGEAITDGEAYTDNEDLEEAYPGQNVARFPQSSRNQGAALARSSEPALEYETPPVEREPSDNGYSDREIPPLMHVPEPRSTRQHDYSPPRSPAAEEETSHRSFSDSDFDALDVDQRSDGPPDFVAPDPSNRHSINRPSYEEEAPESPQPAPLSAIEERLEQVCSNRSLIFTNEFILVCNCSSDFRIFFNIFKNNSASKLYAASYRRIE